MPLVLLQRAGRWVAALALAGGASSAACHIGDGGAGASCAATDTVVSDHRLTHGAYEPDLAAHAAGRVVAVWFAGTIASQVLGYAVSRDRGASWSPAELLVPPDGHDAADPSIDVGPDGTFHLAFLGAGPLRAHRLFVARLRPGARRFSEPIDITSPLLLANPDKPVLRVDNAGRVLVTYMAFLGSSAVVTAVSEDRGATFEHRRLGPGALGTTCQDSAGGPEAALYAVHWGPSGEQPGIHLLRSIDGGATWARPSSVEPLALDAAYTDPTCAVRGRDVWISYGLAARPDSRSPGRHVDEVRLLHSGDDGFTFDPPVKVSDGPADARYLLPRLAWSPRGLAFVYYQGVPLEPAELVLALSPDGGMTWSRSTLAVTGTFTADRSSRRWMGDYIGLASSEGKLHAAYVENAATPNRIRVVSFCDADALPAPATPRAP